LRHNGLRVQSPEKRFNEDVFLVYKFPKKGASVAWANLKFLPPQVCFTEKHVSFGAGATKKIKIFAIK